MAGVGDIVWGCGVRGYLQQCDDLLCAGNVHHCTVGTKQLHSVHPGPFCCLLGGCEYFRTFKSVSSSVGLVGGM